MAPRAPVDSITGVVLKPDSVKCKTGARATEAEGDSFTHQLCDLEQITGTFTFLIGRMAWQFLPPRAAVKMKEAVPARHLVPAWPRGVRGMPTPFPTLFLPSSWGGTS